MTFEVLREEIDRWSGMGLRPSLWWRDDDAASDTPALRRLLGIADRHGIPLGLAVVPAKLSGDAIPLVAACAHCVVLQHGYAHRNHAPHGEKSSELGAHRPLHDVAAELALGRDRLSAAFGTRSAPLLVPPWNRIDPDVAAMLPAQGFRGLSTFAPRRQATPLAGFVQCNTHVDLVAWRDNRSFVGADNAAALLAAHLAARREARVDPLEPTGLLTHHLEFDSAAWEFVERLFAFTREHPAVQWLTPWAAFHIASATSVRSA